MNYENFKITKRTALNPDNVVMIRLKTVNKISFQSGI